MSTPRATDVNENDTFDFFSPPSQYTNAHRELRYDWSEMEQVGGINTYPSAVIGAARRWT